MSNIISLRKLFVVAGLLIRLPGFSQDTPRAQHYLSIGHDNDFLNAIGLRTDQYYTGGVFVQYGVYGKSGHGLPSKILFAPGHPEKSYYKAGLSFLMYSPTNLRLHTPQLGDYPYSGTLMFDLSRETMPTSKSLFRSEIWLGVTGPLAQGEWAQQTLHKSMHFIIPRGWDYQLPNTPVINYNVYFEKNLASLSDHLHLNGLGYAQLGTMADAAKAGFDLVFSTNANDYFPSRQYSNCYAEDCRRIKFFAAITPAVKFVAYNSLVEGGLFSNKDYYHIAAGDVSRVMFEGAGSVGIRTRGFSFFYKEIFQTNEFKSVHYHAWGSAFITIRL